MSTICFSTFPIHPTASPIATSRVVSSSSCPIPSQLRTNAWFNGSLTIDNSNRRKSSKTAALYSSASANRPTVSPITASKAVPSSSLRPIPSQLRTNAWINRSLTIDNSNTRKSSKTATTTNNNRTKNSNVSRSSTNTENDVIEKIQNCRNAFELGSIMRMTNNSIFAYDRASKALIERIKGLASRMRVRDAAGLLNNLSKERVPSQRRNLHYGLMTLLADVSTNKMNECKAKDMSMIANALAKKGIKNDRLFNDIAAKAIKTIYTFNAQGLANVANAYAKINHRHPHLFDEIATASIPMISTFKAQALANTSNAFAKMDHHSPHLFDKIATASIPIISTFNAQNLANTANAYAKMDHRHPELFHKIASASICIISSFKAQELANTANAYAKMDHRCPNLFDKIATASIPIITTFTAQALANIANAYAKMDHHHPELFEKIAQASIPIIGTFKAQALANTASAYAKINHPHVALFDNIATASIPVINSFNAQNLANIASAYGKARFTGKKTEILFSYISNKMINESLENSWTQQNLVEVAYAFMKLRITDEKLLDVIGKAIVSRKSIDLDARQLGNLAVCFNKNETPSSSQVLKLVYSKFCSIKVDQLEIQSVADISSAMCTSQRLDVVSSKMIDFVVALAIIKVDQCRMEDVRDILLAFSCVKLSNDTCNKLLVAYKPFVKKYLKDLSGPNQTRICNTYTEAGIVI